MKEVAVDFRSSRAARQASRSTDHRPRRAPLTLLLGSKISAIVQPSRNGGISDKCMERGQRRVEYLHTRGKFSPSACVIPMLWTTFRVLISIKLQRGKD